MKKLKVGIYGIRGIVGRTLLKRIYINKDYKKFKIYKLSKNSHFKKMNIIVSCKEANFSKKITNEIKKVNWNGYYLDTSSYLRKKNTIVLDPINKDYILKKIVKEKFFSGSNCTVSLMLMSIIGILKLDIKKIYCTTFQSVSGGGYKLFNNFLNQNRKILDLFKKNKYFLNYKNTNIFNKSLCYSLFPWIDKKKEHGFSKEENKGCYETCKILKKKIKVFSTCVRVCSLRCHSLNLILNLKNDISLSEFKKNISNNKYIKIIKNNKKETIKYLNPLFCMEKEVILVGRIRKITKREFSIFVIGDQLLWGATEPIRRMLHIINNVNKN
ncbi:aspartate-semialdehyde dehydrogenase [Candidatus Vidania fulgoroideorum]